MFFFLHPLLKEEEEEEKTTFCVCTIYLISNQFPHPPYDRPCCFGARVHIIHVDFFV